MKTIRIIVKGGDGSRITISKEKGKKGFLTFLTGKKEPEALFGKDGRSL